VDEVSPRARVAPRGRPFERKEPSVVRVEQLMTKDVRSVCPSDSLRDASRLMYERDCGFLPVIRGGGSAKVVGVVTDRDVCMAAYARDQAPSEIRVESAMTTNVRWCRAGDRISGAEELMREAQVRRLPVVDEANQLVGVISLSDIALEAARERMGAEREVSEAEVGETLATISQPREIAARSGR
jgi:CBS domain-containing protein